MAASQNALPDGIKPNNCGNRGEEPVQVQVSMNTEGHLHADFEAATAALSYVSSLETPFMMETNALSTQSDIRSPRYISLDRALPINAACQACRSKHQRCDGMLPICLRCKKGNRSCSYAPSRRGRSIAHLHPGKLKASEVSTLASGNIIEGLNMQLSPLRSPSPEHIGDDAGMQPKIATDFAPEMEMGADVQMPDLHFEDLAVISFQPQVSESYSLEERPSINPIYCSTFYSSFWPSHPFLPSDRDIEDYLRDTESTSLIHAINYIGSLYACAGNNQIQAMTFPRKLHEYPQNAFAVQSLILLAISSHMSNNSTQAQAFLQTATEISLAIGLHRHDFDASHGRGSHAMAEIWHRTWWELYILDIMFAGLNQTSNMWLKGVESDVLLPCEEAIYHNGDAYPRARSSAEFDRRFFAEEEIEYSSFSYRIAAARALSGIIPVSIAPSLQALPSHTEAELVLENLVLHLPKHMQSFVNRDGSINEILFQTHMMIHASNIYLHRPRSILAASGLIHQITCAPNAATWHSESILYHTKKTVDAADGICQMISASPSLYSRTPFFVCAVALQAIVHMSAYGLAEWSQKRSLMQQQIQMSIGALKKLSEIWETASIVLREVKSMARAVLDPPRSVRFSDDRRDTTSAHHSLEEAGIGETLSANLEDLVQGDDESWFDDFLGQN